MRILQDAPVSRFHAGGRGVFASSLKAPPLRLCVLSRSARIGSTRRLVEAGRARGHRVRVIDPLKVRLHLDGHAGHLLYGAHRLQGYDAVIPRIAQSVSAHGLAVVNQLVLQGVPVLNGADAIGQARNKMRSLQLLSAHGLLTPATVMAREPSELREMVKLVGGPPVLVKLLQGQGQDRRGVMVLESLQSLGPALDAILGLGHSVMVQSYVKQTQQDLRVLVVGGVARVAVHRRARPGRVYRTLNLGAHYKAATLTSEVAEAAQTAAQLLGLEVAAVDLLSIAGKPRILEVNSSPNLWALERATGTDLAGMLVERAEALAAQRPVQASGRPRTRAATNASP